MIEYIIENELFALLNPQRKEYRDAFSAGKYIDTHSEF